jgi:RNA polymerase sigma-70 factor (ECF subfamily)
MEKDTGQHPIVAHIPHLRRYARALLGDRAMAEDLVQDCLERAWSRFHLWRDGSNLRTWLFTIMHNLHANAVRDGSRRPGLVSLDDSGAAFPIRATQEDRLDLAPVEDALARLSLDQRQVVLLVGIEDMSYQQAAEVLGVPIGTVMSRLHRGRERLRDLLAGNGGAMLRRVK